ncbi:hypothetical protein [Hamadaea tsunoensis]|uniref:hypothetical protein n=1 Tax=Hamadaea tsunoensis TaxID=53368 RepID=UPI0012FBD0FE|nr:hypothetical protein [Hamadaea tsunoensis]
MERHIDPRWWTEGAIGDRVLPMVLAERDIGSLFQFLHQRGWSWFAIATAVSLPDARVREIAAGRRQVLAYTVLERIAEGLEIPRHFLGLGLTAPHQATGAHEATAGHAADVLPEVAAVPHQTAEGLAVRRRVAVCGSRGPESDDRVIDAAVRGLGRLCMTAGLDVSHGPLGVGVEVLTYVADHYRPPGLSHVTGVFGRPNVVRGVVAAVIVGGGGGTRDETDLALAAGVPLIPINASGGAARRAYALLERDVELRRWMPDGDFAMLRTCAEADAITEVVGGLLTRCAGGGT